MKKSLLKAALAICCLLSLPAYANFIGVESVSKNTPTSLKEPVFTPVWYWPARAEKKRKKTVLYEPHTLWYQFIRVLGVTVREDSPSVKPSQWNPPRCDLSCQRVDVSEPGTWALLLVGVCGVLCLRRCARLPQ